MYGNDQGEKQFTEWFNDKIKTINTIKQLARAKLQDQHVQPGKTRQVSSRVELFFLYKFKRLNILKHKMK